MRQILLILFLLANSSSYSFLLPDEKKINIAREKYQYGFYDECVNITHKFARPEVYSINTYLASDAYALKAAAHFRLAEFKAYTKTLDEWKKLSAAVQIDTCKRNSELKMAQLFLEVGDLNSCDSILSLLSNLNDKDIQSCLDVVKAGLWFRKGEIIKAGNILSARINEYKKRLDQGESTNLDFAFAKDMKSIYSDLVLRKIETFIVQGESDSASALNQLHQNWLLKNLKSTFYFRELDRLSAELEFSRSDNKEAYNLFMKAYQYDNFSDGEYRKIELLASVINLSEKLGLTDQSQKLLRRLQMLAYVNSGKKEPFQFIYERTLIEIQIRENNFSAAGERLDRYKEIWGKLPEWHFLKLTFLSLESDLLVYKPGVQVSQTIDSLFAHYANELGESHEYPGRLLMEKIYFDIHFGTSVVHIEKDLERVQKNFISKGRTGRYMLDYLELSSLYYGLMDNFKLSSEFAGKANEYAGKLFGENSEKRIYYHSLFLKSLLLTDAYSQFYAQFNDLRNTFSTRKWNQPDEARKNYLVLSSIYKIIGEKDESKSNLLSIIRKLEETSKENIYERAKAESQLAYVYYQTGNLFRAEKLINRSIEEKKTLLPFTSVAFIEDLFFKAELELQKGNFKDTEICLADASEIISNTYGKKSLLYQEYLRLHADYCISIGDYKRGDEYVTRSQEIATDKFGPGDLIHVPLLMRRALIMAHAETENLDKEKIASLYEEALAILSKTIGTENILYMDVLKKNAHFLIKTGQLEKADSVLTVVEKYWKEKSGNSNIELLEVYLLKGDIAYEKDNYSRANELFGSVKDLASSIYDKSNSYYTNAYARQAKVAYMQHKPAEALGIMEDLLPKYLSFVSKNFPTLSFREKSRYWNNMKDQFEFYIFLVLTNKELTEKYSRKVYDQVIATKAILLSNNIKIRENIMSSGDTVLVNAYNSWIDLKEYYTSLSSLTKAEQEEQKIDLKAIEAEIEKREKHLSNKSELFKTEDKISNATFKEVSNILSENEYAVELVRFRNFYKTFTDTINYAALIVKKGVDMPQAVVFPEGSQFETRALKVTRNSARFHVNDVRSYDLFWSPIESEIPEGATVYLSAEGVYNQFNLEMLEDHSGKFLLDKIELVQVTNTKELLRGVWQIRKNKHGEESSEIVLGGNPDFYANDEAHYAGQINDLPGAAKEIESISTLLTSNETKVTKQMSGNLTEEWVKNLNSPKVFHVATHGYYSEVKNSDDENSALLNSGLLFAGAGDILGTESHVNSQDGILTAYEAMNLKLDNTDLVVLSACETGLGEVQAGEGVYGLQRSFLIAGSKAIVISLYKVNDEVTQKLMVEFYTNWIATGDIRHSFIKAKQKIKSEYPDNPIYWGAFVLIEGRPELKVKDKKVAGM